jgi:hypothetical protein
MVAKPENTADWLPTHSLVPSMRRPVNSPEISGMPQNNEFCSMLSGAANRLGWRPRG